MRWTAITAVAGFSIAVAAAGVALTEGARARKERAQVERLHAELSGELRGLRTALDELRREAPRELAPLQLSERRPVRERAASPDEGAVERVASYASDGNLEEAWRRSVVERFRGLDADGREDALEDLAELAKAGDQEALGLILQSLQDQDAGVREEALEALQELDDPALVEQIIPLTADPNPGVREEAVEALRGMSPERAGPIMTAMLRDADRDVVLEALDSLRRLDYPDGVSSIAELTQGTDLDLAARAAATLRSMGEHELMMAALDRLTPDLYHPDALERINAIRRVQRVGGDEARAYLERVLAQDASVSVRLEAQRALERNRRR